MDSYSTMTIMVNHNHTTTTCLSLENLFVLPTQLAVEREEEGAQADLEQREVLVLVDSESNIASDESNSEESSCDEEGEEIQVIEFKEFLGENWYTHCSREDRGDALLDAHTHQEVSASYLSSLEQCLYQFSPRNSFNSITSEVLLLPPHHMMMIPQITLVTSHS